MTTKYVLAEEFGRQHGQPESEVLQMIGNGKLFGAIMDERWHVRVDADGHAARLPDSKDDPEAAPTVVVLLNMFAVVTLICGLVMALLLLPGEAVDGRTWRAVAYASSVTWAIVGLVQAVLFAAVAQAVMYLKRIEINTRPS